MVWRTMLAALLAGLVLWGGFTLFHLTGDRYQRLFEPLHLTPAFGTWQVLEGSGEVDAGRMSLTEVGRFGQVVVGVLLPEPMAPERIAGVEMRVVDGPKHLGFRLGWSHSRSMSTRETAPAVFGPDGWLQVGAEELRARENEPIRGLVVSAGGLLDPPLVVDAFRVVQARPGFAEFHRLVVGEWFDVKPWSQRSVNMSGLGTLRPVLSPVVAVAAWVGLTWGFLLLGRLRGRRWPVGEAVLVLVVAWVVLAGRWQLEMLYRAGDALSLAPKTLAERRAAEPDGAEFVLLEELKSMLGKDETRRLFLVSDHRYVGRRVRYHALPLSARIVDDVHIEQLLRHSRPGDWLLIMSAPRWVVGALPGEEAEEGAIRQELMTADCAGAYCRLRADDSLSRRAVFAVPGSLAPGFYRISFDAAADYPDSRIGVHVLALGEGRDRQLLGIREMQPVEGENSLVFALPEKRPIRIVLELLENEARVASSMLLERVEDDSLRFAGRHESGPFVVVSQLLDYEYGGAYEIR